MEMHVIDSLKHPQKICVFEEKRLRGDGLSLFIGYLTNSKLLSPAAPLHPLVFEMCLIVHIELLGMKAGSLWAFFQELKVVYMALSSPYSLLGTI